MPTLTSPFSRPSAPGSAAPPPPKGTPPGAGGAVPAVQGAQYAQVQDRVVQALLRRGAVSAEEVTAAEAARKAIGGRQPLWRALVDVDSVDRDRVFEQAAATYAFRLAPVGDRPPEAGFAKTVIESFESAVGDKLVGLGCVPYAYAQDQPSGVLKLVFVTEDPMRPELQRVIDGLGLEKFEVCYAPGAVVEAVIAEAFPRKNEYLERLAESTGPDVDYGVSFESGEKTLVDEEALEAEISQSALLNLTEAILIEGVRLGASDIHIWPNAQRKTEVHFRTDGRLQHWHTEDRGHPEALLAVFKDAALNVDRFERDMAQDGFIQRKVDGTLIRYRVSILPIANANPEVRAESIVIRILDDRKVITDLGKLGLLEGALKQFNKAIRQPHGMVILTGPTGSGKSTTLVAALSNVVTPEVNVLTVEDPVEYIIPGVRQIKLSHKLSLEQALRAILRHDPDVVMVGEMRDKDTAELAIKLANTGHLTFSTLHTNDAPSAVSRLYKMGLEPFLIAYAINLVVAQRLIRTLCPACKEVETEPDALLLGELGFTPEQIEGTTFYQARTSGACPTCKGKGYKGRRACAEALYFTPAIQAAIVGAGEEVNENEIREIAESEGMLTLGASARVLVERGEVSVEEMLRVAGGEH
ncbi:GspE/PulE family protein [Rubrivirga sp. S365]|uniref:GspE/PulE family protein n=1 Tax=Rubrivirga litoralis TaxID=3075598 RepID=A0ABU3BV41_9BACT|nr:MULTISPECIES: GspE/PulE family protein [unclassified Rubrivirga]MDT0633161.1 GspE/PulE family protein [Rubrivirga sp. F394]MDT7857768.1 GspE/PulE family protein [Rubrivirga sp. S365]